MKWEVNCKVWEMEERNDSFSIIFNQITEEFMNLIPEEPPLGFKPIVLVNDLLFEHRVHWPFDRDNYLIGLNVEENSYGDAAYQFAHELSHIYTDPRITNWTIKLIAHVSSFYMLDRLVEMWKETPPKEIGKTAVDDFQNCRNDLMKEAYHKIDLRQHQLSSNWIKKETKRIHDRPEFGNRIIFNVIALEILPFFKKDPAIWSIIPYISKCSYSSQTEELEDLNSIKEVIIDLDKLNELCPDHLKPSFAKLVNQIWE